jgi:hypothetical protein
VIWTVVRRSARRRAYDASSFRVMAVIVDFARLAAAAPRSQPRQGADAKGIPRGARTARGGALSTHAVAVRPVRSGCRNGGQLGWVSRGTARCAVGGRRVTRRAPTPA